MKIRSVGVELYHGIKRADRRDELYINYQLDALIIIYS